MSQNRSINVGSGIVKQSASPIKFFVDSAGEYWICDGNVDPQGDFGTQGCTAHSEVHLVK